MTYFNSFKIWQILWHSALHSKFSFRTVPRFCPHFPHRWNHSALRIVKNVWLSFLFSFFPDHCLLLPRTIRWLVLPASTAHVPTGLVSLLSPGGPVVHQHPQPVPLPHPRVTHRAPAHTRLLPLHARPTHESLCSQSYPKELHWRRCPRTLRPLPATLPHPSLRQHQHHQRRRGLQRLSAEPAEGPSVPLYLRRTDWFYDWQTCRQLLQLVLSVLFMF